MHKSGTRARMAGMTQSMLRSGRSGSYERSWVEDLDLFKPILDADKVDQIRAQQRKTWIEKLKQKHGD